MLRLRQGTSLEKQDARRLWSREWGSSIHKQTPGKRLLSPSPTPLGCRHKSHKFCLTQDDPIRLSVKGSPPQLVTQLVLALPALLAMESPWKSVRPPYLNPSEKRGFGLPPNPPTMWISHYPNSQILRFPSLECPALHHQAPFHSKHTHTHMYHPHG